MSKVQSKVCSSCNKKFYYEKKLENCPHCGSSLFTKIKKKGSWGKYRKNQIRLGLFKPDRDTEVKKKSGYHKRKYTLIETIKYKFRKSSTIRKILFLSFVIMLVSCLVYQVMSVGFLKFVYYISEITFVFSLIYMLLKKLDNIRTNTTLSLFCLRIFSAIISFIGLYIIAIMYLIGYPILLVGGSLSSMYSFFGLSDLYHLFTFGGSFGFYGTTIVAFAGFGLGMLFIGGYLFFKFQRKTGTFHWLGRI